MLIIKAIRLEVNTTDRAFLGEFNFSNGLNIIKGNNTVGKSTLFQSILYGLGMEELLGGKNEKTMQSALKDMVEYPLDDFHSVTNSQIFLEVFNGTRSITTQRSIKGGFNTKLIRVFNGSLLTESKDAVDFVDTWIHDKGGASNIERGFHSLLENFLGWELPNVHYSNGESRKLYIQTIFPSFIVEQKSGWADFLSTIPFYGIKNVESKAIEFLLNLDLFDNDFKKQVVKDRKSDLIFLWKKAFDDISLIARRGMIEITGIPNHPQVLSDITPVSLFLFINGKRASLEEVVKEWQLEFDSLQSQPVVTAGENVIKATFGLKKLQESLDEQTLQWELLSQSLRTEKNKFSQYEKQLFEVREELRQNKDVKKIYNLGGDAGLVLSNQTCPTCSQDLNDTLFLPDIHLNPMNIDENINYVEAQENMILSYLNIAQKKINDSERILSNIFRQITEIREEIRSIKQELVSDERLPSISDIEKRISLRNKINLYEKLKLEIDESIYTFYSLSEDWNNILKDEEKLPKNYLSRYDYEKINELENYFKSLLRKFEYTSKDNKSISISKEIDKKFLLPVVESEGIKYNIRFDSSGSDLIKAIWSYYCALFKLGFSKKINHPGLLIFDEPAQQGVGPSGFNMMLKELSLYKNGQSFIFSSFNESVPYYNSAVNGIKDFNLIDISERSIMPR